MQAEEIERYLADLGQELQHMETQQPVHLLLVGGAFMLTQLHNRPTTNDVDVLLKNVDDPTTSPLYRNFKVAVRAVANRNQIPLSWINDVIGDFLRSASVVPQGTLWRKYGLLEVYIPPREYILALKLLAGRQKDRGDIETLCQQLHIRMRWQAQQIVDRYIPNKQVQQINDLKQTLTLLFP